MGKEESIDKPTVDKQTTRNDNLQQTDEVNKIPKTNSVGREHGVNEDGKHTKLKQSELFIQQGRLYKKRKQVSTVGSQQLHGIIVKPPSGFLWTFPQSVFNICIIPRRKLLFSATAQHTKNGKNY